jgi:hypothetical protein
VRKVLLQTAAKMLVAVLALVLVAPELGADATANRQAASQGSSRVELNPDSAQLIHLRGARGRSSRPARAGRSRSRYPRGGPNISEAERNANREVARRVMVGFGWGEEQWPCLDALGSRESGFNHLLWNRRGSGAYGIGQALPPSKMAGYGPDHMTNVETQAKWWMDYISKRVGKDGRPYVDPCGANRHQLKYGTY